ncbi:MAG TPA: hypothetical protein VMA77_15080 [Solirubrobacteraceae bacterium]|nr:hypothetical protein [Solirubrobacteraceae bacterium]
MATTDDPRRPRAPRVRAPDRDPHRRGPRARPHLFETLFETIACGERSLLVKFGVQVGLWGGAVDAFGIPDEVLRAPVAVR